MFIYSFKLDVSFNTECLLPDVDAYNIWKSFTG